MSILALSQTETASEAREEKRAEGFKHILVMSKCNNDGPRI